MWRRTCCTTIEDGREELFGILTARGNSWRGRRVMEAHPPTWQVSLGRLLDAQEIARTLVFAVGTSLPAPLLPSCTLAPFPPSCLPCSLCAGTPGVVLMHLLAALSSRSFAYTTERQPGGQRQCHPRQRRTEGDVKRQAQGQRASRHSPERVFCLDKCISYGRGASRTAAQ
jgi:hypothetical protein